MSKSSKSAVVDLPTPTSDGFQPLGVEDRFLAALAAAGIATPTDIQREMIPPVLDGRDVVGQAKTGTGKTLAFGLPLLQRLDESAGLQVLCMVPTRELASQVLSEIRMLSKGTGVRVAAVYGGIRITAQQSALKRNPHFLIGTPGRLLDLLGRRLLDIHELKAVVLDEVDRMLDIGFRDDIRRILSHIKVPHQTVVVSATIDEEIRKLINRHTREPVEVNVSRDELTVDLVEQSYVSVERPDKYPLLKLLLESEKPGLAIVFTNTRGAAKRLSEKLRKDGHKVGEIHGDLVQRKREKVLESFRNQDIHLLVATDVAARGLHVDDVTHVINFDIPVDPQSYVHRIGRTARMGTSGRAITFVSREEGKLLTGVEMLINKEVPALRFEGFTPSVAPPPAPVAPVAEEGPTISTRYRAAEEFVLPDGTRLNVPRRTLASRFRPTRSSRPR